MWLSHTLRIFSKAIWTKSLWSEMSVSLFLLSHIEFLTPLCQVCVFLITHICCQIIPTTNNLTIHFSDSFTFHVEKYRITGETSHIEGFRKGTSLRTSRMTALDWTTVLLQQWLQSPYAKLYSEDLSFHIIGKYSYFEGD